MKEKNKRRPILVPKKSKRVLFKARASKIATIIKHGYGSQNQKKIAVVRAGPFLVHHGTQSYDIDILKFVFKKCNSEEFMNRYKSLAVARDDGRHVTRDDLTSLGPEAFVCGHVINMFAGYLSHQNQSDWFFPTYFGDDAGNYEAATGYSGWVTHTRSRCGLNTIASRINDCKRIFIPMRDSKPMGHWYLLVVHVKEKKAEIVDSAPNTIRDSDRMFLARMALNLLDSVFLTEVLTYMDDDVLFSSFDFVATEKIHLQPNGYDCGVFVIRNMQNFGKDWSKNYVSVDHRASLIVECVRNPLNNVEGLHEMIKEELAYVEAEGPKV